MKKSILITGSSSGIGLASAKLFAAQGWSVAATMRNPDAAHELDLHSDMLITRLDVQDPTSIDEAVAAALAQFGGIDVLVNNAGFGQYGLFESVPREKIQEQFEVNVFGVMDVTRAILPHFRANKGGTIVNVSSGAGIFTLPMISIYCASKFALEGFSESLAFELASQNIAVKLVIPHGGVTGTNFSERAGASSASKAPAASGEPDAAASAGSMGAPDLSDYDDFVARTAAAFASMTATRSIGAGEVAQAIFDAATDGTSRLRYLVGDDSRGFIRARRELEDQACVDFMRSRFPAKS